MAKMRKPGAKNQALLGLCLLLLLLAALGTTLAFVVTQTPSLQNIFKPLLAPEGDLVIRKTVEHPFGAAYALPDDLDFDFRVELGAEYANETVATSAGAYTADENGMIEVSLAAGASLGIPEIPADTFVRVTELQNRAGFTVDGTETREVTILEDETHTLEFCNIYSPAAVDPVNVQVEGEKKLTGRDWQPGDSFSFLLEYRLAAEEEWSSLGTKTVTYTEESPADFNRFSFTDLVQAMDLAAAGTYAFRISEQAGSLGGVSYDKVVSYFDILVGDVDMDGSLEIQDVEAYAGNASVSREGEDFLVEVEIENTYAPVDGTEAELRITKTLEDRSGQSKAPAGFRFALYHEDGTLCKLSEATTAAGESSISLIYSPVDAGKTFTYVLKEEHAGESIGGLLYDDAEYKIQVSVIDNLDGTIRALVYDYAGVGAEQEVGALDPAIPAGVSNVYAAGFENIYDPVDAEAEISGVKSLSGRALQDGEFRFALYETAADFVLAADASPIQTASNDAAGNFGFDALSFDEVGRYYYVVLEDASAALGGVIYDEARYLLTVDVRDAGGELAASVTVTDIYGEAAAIHFANRYRPVKALVRLSGEKVLEGKPLSAEAFGFQLYASDEDFEYEGEALETVWNDAEGGFHFGEMNYNEAGTWYYVVKEDASAPMKGIEYDETEYHVTVEVEDDGNGSLEPSLQLVAAKGNTRQEVEELLFENRYKAEDASLVLRGEKKLSGASLEDGMFRFELYEADADFGIDGDAIDWTSNDADGDFKFSRLKYSEEGTYHYVVLEDDSEDLHRVRYDDTVYGVIVEVEDDGEGQLVASASFLELGEDGEQEEAEELRFRNRFEPEPEDSQLKLQAKKIVLNTGSESIGPEGFQFQLVNIDTGAKYISTAGEDGLADFLLNYTEEDADESYRYRLTEINDGRANVTYSSLIYEFKVEIDLDKDGELEATVEYDGEEVEDFIASFENIYHKDAEQPVVPEQPEDPKPPVEPESPGTGDESRIFLFVGIAGGSALLLALLLLLPAGRRKQKAKK